VLEDWVWYVILPCSVYAGLTVAALFLRGDSNVAFFVVGGGALCLLLIGIHNAWDSVTHIIVVEGSQSDAKNQK
jgi:hypothetical protein